MLHLTTLPAPASPSDAVAAILSYDADQPDGLTKEIIARAAALGLLAGADDRYVLTGLHDSLDTVVKAAAAHGAGVVNAAVAHLLSTGLLNVPAGGSPLHAKAELAGAVYDVVNHKHLTVAAVTAAPLPKLFAAPGAVGAKDELDGLDLLSEKFETLRVVLTRTLASVRPALYAEYRKIKDGPTATAREDAYEYAFSVLATLIERAKGG